MRAARRTRHMAFAAAVLLVLGCSAATVPGSAPVDGADRPTVSGAWVRPPMGAGRPAAGYLTIAGIPDRADALVAASTTAAPMVEIHETTADGSGMAAMHPVDRIEIPAGATVVLEPGGYHLMLIDPNAELVPGERVEITLTFEIAGEVTVRAEIRQG